MSATEATLGDRYFELITRFPLRPIRSDDELERAIAVVNPLIDQPELSADEDAYLEVREDATPDARGLGRRDAASSDRDS